MTRKTEHQLPTQMKQFEFLVPKNKNIDQKNKTKQKQNLNMINIDKEKSSSHSATVFNKHAKTG